MKPEIVVFAVLQAAGREYPVLYYDGSMPRGLFRKIGPGERSKLVYATRIDYFPISNDLQRLFAEFKALRAAAKLPAQNLKGVERV